LQAACSKGEGDRFRLTRLKRDALEAFELLDRSSHLRVRMAHIELHNFIARARATIRDLSADTHSSIYICVLRFDAQVGILKVRVTQAVPKRVQRLLSHKAIRAASHVVIVKRRELLD
jgi:hypothetical protein